jgi:hypothetical protein
MAETIKIKIDMDSTPVKTLKQELKEATIEAQRLATAEVIDQEALTAAVRRTAELKDAMADVNEQVAVFASGSKYEQASNGLGQIGDAIRNLDFGKAQERAVAFANVAKTIKFSDAIKSVQELGSAFMTVGRAILTNPLFLLAAIIVGIVVVVYKLLDALGVVKVVVDAIGATIKFFTDLWYDLTDAIGLTSKAAEENLKTTVETNKQKSDSLQTYYSEVERTINNELKLLRARDDGSEESANNIIEAERKLIFAKRQAAKEQARLAENTLLIMISTGKATREELEDQKKLVMQLRGAFSDASADALAFDEKVKTDKAKSDKKAADESVKLAQDASKKRQDAEQKAAGKRKQLEADRLAAARLIEDQLLALREDGEQKEILSNALKYERLIQDTSANERLLQEEKDALIKTYQQQQQAAELGIIEKFADDKNAIEQAALDAQLQAETDAMHKRLELQAQETEAQKLANQQRLEERRLVEQGIMNLAESTLSALANNLEQGSAAAKAVAVAQATIDTYKGAQAAYASLVGVPVVGPALAVAGAASAVAIGIGNIRKILAVKPGTTSTPSTSSGGGSPTQTPSMGTSVQPTPVMNMNNGVDPNAGGTVNRQQVYVVDYTDIQNKGNELGMLQNRVTLG